MNIDNQGKQDVKNENENNLILGQYFSYGGFWRRIVSLILDFWPAIIFSFILLIIIYFYRLNFEWLNELIDIAFFINFLVNFYLYFKNGETIGYKLTGLKIVSEKTGKLPDGEKLAKRFIVKCLYLCIPLVNLVSIVIFSIRLLKSKKKQGPHDLRAETIVVKKNKKNKDGLMILLFILTLSILIFESLLPYFIKTGVIN